MKHCLIIITMIMFLSLSYSQKENYHWIFGNGTELDFNQTPPNVTPNNSLGAFCPSTASISDSAGNLIFYANADTVWTKNHVVMENGEGLQKALFGSFINTDGSTVYSIPDPASKSSYYIFFHLFVSKKMFYVKINMNKNMGLGKVVEKHILPYETPYQPLSIALHKNKKDYWLVFINKNQKLNALLINGSGVSSTPVISELGKSFPKLPPYQTYGRLLFSHSMDYMIITVFDEFNGSNKPSPICFYSFNGKTGKAQCLWKMLHQNNFIRGVEFSPNDKYLYISGAKINHGVYQVKLNDDRSILPTNNIQLSSEETFDLQLAPDGKIYFIENYRYLRVINNPDLEGTLCNIGDNKLYLHGKTVNFYFPHFVQRLPNVFSHNISCNIVEFNFPYRQPPTPTAQHKQQTKT